MGNTGFAQRDGTLVADYVAGGIGTIGAKEISYGRNVTFHPAQVAVPRDLFPKILRLIDRLQRSPTLTRAGINGKPRRKRQEECVWIKGKRRKRAFCTRLSRPRSGNRATEHSLVSHGHAEMVQ